MKFNAVGTEQGFAAMEEFGFDLVGLNQIGAPTPGRIADRLHDVASKIELAFRLGDGKGMVNAIAELRRLRLALDAWDIGVNLLGKG